VNLDKNADGTMNKNIETYNISISIFKALKQLITGERSVKELGGPIKIAKYTGKTVEMGFIAVMWFVAMISINLGPKNFLSYLNY
jgi:regulator of sigma E protease